MKSKTQTAGIYNRWLFTLGGGEQVTFAYAEALRDAGYKTTLVTHKKVDVESAEKKMGVSLTDIELRYEPLRPVTELSGISQEYDLFINTSYLDYFPNRSSNGFLSVFFPAEIYLSLWEWCKRTIFLPSLKLLFIYPTDYSGFSHDTFEEGKICKWLGESSEISFSNQTIYSLAIELHVPTFAVSIVESLVFFINKKTVSPDRKRLNHTTNTLRYFFCSSEPIVNFAITHKKWKIQKISLVKLTIPKWRYYLYNIFKLLFPKWEMRLHGGPGVTSLSDIQSYKRIITISKFCQYWIKQYWGLESEVLYPPVNTSVFLPAKNKQNWICHIGRFFVTGHSKKQLELIRVFKELVDSKQLIDWQLHLIGSVHEGANHEAYYKACLNEALGYPIQFHCEAPFVEVREVLSKSKIYWHATGLDEDQKKQPILMEHFGITTVEAMASGCVPIVINAGGQPEIVIAESGFTWNNREELKEYTARVANNSELRQQLSIAAKKRSAYFSKKKFRERFLKILKSNQKT